MKTTIKPFRQYFSIKYALALFMFEVLVIVHSGIPAFAQENKKASAFLQKSLDNEPEKENNCKALLQATKAQDAAKVEELLGTTNPNCEYRADGEPRSPLVAAARNGNLKIGKLLVGAKADVEFHAEGDATPLMAASANGYLDFVKFLVENGAELNTKLTREGTALIVAAREGNLEVVEYLIAQGAEVNAQVNQDGTPLINAVRNQHYKVAELLLKNAADPGIVSPGDEYAMYHAEKSKDKAMIELLKKYSKDHN